MPYSVLLCDIPYFILFPSNLLFPIEPHIFSCTCIVWDVRLHIIKLISNLLNISSLVILDFKKDTNVSLHSLIAILCRCYMFESTFFFSTSPIYNSQEKEDYLLVYFVSIPQHRTGPSFWQLFVHLLFMFILGDWGMVLKNVKQPLCNGFKGDCYPLGRYPTAPLKIRP